MNVKDEIYSEHQYIDQLLKDFKLRDIREVFEDEIQRAVDEKISYRDFLKALLEIEYQGKMNRRTERYLKEARFHKFSTLEEFDFTFPKRIHVEKVKELESLHFLEKGENVVLLGPAGVGKSHIATALGVKACQIGKKVRFICAHQLMDELYKAYEEQSVKAYFKQLNKYPLLIIDDFSHFKLSKEKESLFFQLIRQRYEKNSLIITTNVPLGSWDEIFTSNLAVTAVLDRLLHHCHMISIAGDSYRVKDKIRRPVDD